MKREQERTRKQRWQEKRGKSIAVNGPYVKTTKRDWAEGEGTNPIRRHIHFLESRESHTFVLCISHITPKVLTKYGLWQGFQQNCSFHPRLSILSVRGRISGQHCSLCWPCAPQKELQTSLSYQAVIYAHISQLWVSNSLWLDAEEIRIKNSGRGRLVSGAHSGRVSLQGMSLHRELLTNLSTGAAFPGEVPESASLSMPFR